MGGWAVPYVGVFFRPVGDEPFFLILKCRPSTGAWEYHRRHCCTPLSFTTVRAAALPYCCPVIIIVFFSTYIQRMIPLLPYVPLHCRTALLLFLYSSAYIQSMTQHQFVFVRIPAGNRHTSGVPLLHMLNYQNNHS